MTRKEHLLTILQEECNEVGQRASKMLRFGVTEIQPGQTLSNSERLIFEFNDLIAVMQLLRREGVLPSKLVRDEYVEAKKKKIEHFLQYSKEQGTLTENKCDPKVETVEPSY